MAAHSAGVVEHLAVAPARLAHAALGQEQGKRRYTVVRPTEDP
jgi:hypothetical protein